MKPELSLKTEIELILESITLLQLSLELLLENNYAYAPDPDSLIGAYTLQQFKYKHYLKLPYDLQSSYCQTRTLLCEMFYRVACLYENSGELNNALKYHFIAVLHGRLNIIFNPRQAAPEVSDSMIKFTHPFFNGLSALFGVGQTQNYTLAYKHLSESLRFPQPAIISYARLMLGLMQYHGLGVPGNLLQAQFHFRAAISENSFLASQYLGLCELSLGNYKNAIFHLRPALQQGFPLAQTSMSIMYKHGYGMFAANPEKSRNLLSLAQKQQEYKKIISI